MKHLLLSAIVLVGLTVASAYAITEAQSTVLPALKALKLALVPSKVIGGPQTFKVTQDTVDLMSKLLKEGGTITLENNGSLTIHDGQAEK